MTTMLIKKALRVGDVVWYRNNCFDGNYLHHRPQKTTITERVSDNELLYSDPYVKTKDGLIKTSRLHRTEFLAYLAFYQEAKKRNMRQSFLDRIEYHLGEFIGAD